MGGFIGMTLAAHYRRRCRRLVLIDAVGVLEPSALPPIAQSVSRLGRTYPSKAAALSYVRSAGVIAPWNEFWDNYIEWEIESAGESAVRIRTDLAAVSEDSADAAEHDVYALWRRIRCPLAGIAMPVTYLAGTWDAITSAEDMRAASKNTPNSEYVELPATHYLPLQFSERVATELRRVIDRCSL